MVLPIAEEKSLIKPEEKHAAVLTLIWGGGKEVKLNGAQRTTGNRSAQGKEEPLALRQKHHDKTFHPARLSSIMV